MKNVPASPPTINSPSELLLFARNKLIEACALARVVADELAAMPVGTVREPLQALANVCERLVEEAFDLVEQLNVMVSEPPSPPPPPAPNN